MFSMKPQSEYGNDYRLVFQKISHDEHSDFEYSYYDQKPGYQDDYFE